MKELIKSAGKAYFRARGYYPADIHGQSFRLDPHHIAFWRAAARKRWEPATFRVLSETLTPDATYVDIGAWIGPTVLYAARLCREVWCFEPDPTALRHLLWNLDLNDIRNVTAFGVALSDAPGLLRLSTFGDARGDSRTSLLADEDAFSFNALALTWEQIRGLAEIPRPDLLKIDIEGAEFRLLPEMADYLRDERPPLYLSTHAALLPEGDRMDALEMLREILSVYPTVRDEFLAPAAPEALVSEETRDSFASFLFLPE